jgi:hypothetical protein
LIFGHNNGITNHTPLATQPDDKVREHTIRDAIQNPRQKVLGDFADIFRIFPLCICASTGLDFFIGECKDVFAGGVLNRYVDVTVGTSSAMDSRFRFFVD